MTSKQEPYGELVVRRAYEADLDDIEEMVNDFVKGHPAKTRSRSRLALSNAYFGPNPVANLVVVAQRGRVVGMGQWTMIYDMFWSMYGDISIRSSVVM